ncbi:MAG: GC-type dockerin domain-anchored protein, partial [Planctomycetota bacterium]
MKTRCARMLVAAGGVGVAAWAAAADEDHTFTTDDGVFASLYSVLNEEAFVGNYYTASEAIAIGRVEFAPGFGLEGSPYQVLIYSDPDNDGDPTNAELLSRTDAVVGSQPGALNELFVESIDIEPVEVEGGFFVAVWIQDQLPFGGLVGYDASWYTAPSARRLAGMNESVSWVVRPPLPPVGMGGVGALDIETLGNNLRVANSQQNWVIRAFGDDAPANSVGCVADVNGDGAATPGDFNAWIVAFNTGSTGCDQNGDGACTAGDFNAWVLNFNT